MGELQSSLEAIGGAGGTVVAVSADGPSDAKALAERLGVTFPLVSDPDLAIAEAYGIRQVGKDAALPAAFVLDAEGKVAFAYVGVSPTDRPTVAQLVEALKTL